MTKLARIRHRVYPGTHEHAPLTAMEAAYLLSLVDDLAAALRRVPVVRLKLGREGEDDFYACPGCDSAGQQECASDCRVPIIEAALARLAEAAEGETP